MVDQSLARLIVGIAGNVISMLLFLSPGPTFLRIWRKKSTEEFHPYPYLASLMNCMFWMFYGLPVVHPDSTLVITINSAGFLMEFIYLDIFLFYTTRKNRKIIALVLLGEITLLAIVVVITLLCFHSHASRSMFVGTICVICGVIMYGSPLTIIGQIMMTKNPEFMPLWVCLAGFFNGIVWFIYAFLKTVDPYIATGNGIGAAFGLFQLFVYAYYTIQAKKNGPVESEVKQDEILA